MTPIEKAENSLNQRVHRLQSQLQTTTSDPSRRFLVQTIVICAGIGEAITDYVQGIHVFARARHGELKQTQVELTAEHASLLKEGQDLLNRLKATPADRELRDSIESAQRRMAAIQKSLRRGANTLQRELSPSMSLIDQMAVSLRRFAEAEDKDSLKRTLKSVVEHVQDLYRSHPPLPVKGLIDADGWRKAAYAAIDEAPDFYDAYARAGIQILLALAMLSLAIGNAPPQSAGEASQRANEMVAQKLKSITERFSA